MRPRGRRLSSRAPAAGGRDATVPVRGDTLAAGQECGARQPAGRAAGRRAPERSGETHRRSRRPRGSRPRAARAGARSTSTRPRHADEHRRGHGGGRSLTASCSEGAAADAVKDRVQHRRAAARGPPWPTSRGGPLMCAAGEGEVLRCGRPRRRRAGAPAAPARGAWRPRGSSPAGGGARAPPRPRAGRSCRRR